MIMASPSLIEYQQCVYSTVTLCNQLMNIIIVISIVSCKADI